MTAPNVPDDADVVVTPLWPLGTPPVVPVPTRLLAHLGVVLRLHALKLRGDGYRADGWLRII